MLSGTDVTVNDYTDRTAEKNNQSFDKDNGLPDTVIMHYTAGSSAQSSVNHLTKHDVKASAHLVIGRSGEVFQLVPFDKIAWHAGISRYGGREGFNKYSIGIEMDNAGLLKKVGHQYQAWFGTKYGESDVLHATHRNETTPQYWHTYTEAQWQVAREIVELIVNAYDIREILGHEEISPGRKQDPGPAFELDRFRNMILGTNRESADVVASAELPEKGIVDGSKLNIRANPGGQFDKVAKPLPRGQEVTILDEENGWYKVETVITGWVSKAYIDTTS